MSKKKKIIISVISSIIGVAIIVFGTLYFVIDFKPKGKHVIDVWHKEDAYSTKYVSVVEKDPNKEFTILNLTDIQLSDFEPSGAEDTMKALIKELIDRTNPNLITLTGDQIWTNHSKHALRREISWFEEFKIPWAPVFGNHDGEGTATLDYQCDLYEEAEHCLFKRGPSNIGGIGNYVVNIKVGNSIFKSLYMLDLGTIDNFTQGQIDFVKWNADGNKAKNGGEYPASFCFCHRAINAYNKAWVSYLMDPSIAIGDVYRSFYISHPDCGNEFFELAKEINVTDIICGHQHGNHFTIPYDGVRLTFSLKTGDMCSIYEDPNNPHVFVVGGSSIVLSGENVTYHSNYVGEQYRIKTK